MNGMRLGLLLAAPVLAIGSASAQQDAFSAIYTNAYNRCMSAAINSQAECERAAVQYATSLLKSAPLPQTAQQPTPADSAKAAPDPALTPQEAYNNCMRAGFSSQPDCARAANEIARRVNAQATAGYAAPQSRSAPPTPSVDQGAVAAQRARRLCVGSAMMAGADAMRALAACSGAGAALPRSATCQNIGGIVTCSGN
jgi:hypothetical protein